MKQKISVIGLGKLGLPTATVLSAAGHEVVGIDLEERIVRELNHQTVSLQENGVADLFRRFPFRSALSDYRSVKDSDASFIIVPTPSTKNGGFDASYVFSAVEKIVHHLPNDKYHVVNVVSTVSPGTMQRVRNMVPQDHGVTYNPEFIALGNVIDGVKNPDMVMIGANDDKAANTIECIYQHVVAQYIPIKKTSLENAELAKIALNTFVTMKINFANTLARVCDQMPNGNVDDVTQILGIDTRIGNKYLKGGLSYGGPCFPRDTWAFAHAAGEFNVHGGTAMMTDYENIHHMEYVAEQCLKMLTGIPKDKRIITVLGSAYKAGTPVQDHSPSVILQSLLEKECAETRIYSPYEDHSPLDKLWNSDLAIITLPLDEITRLSLPSIAQTMRTVQVYDTIRAVPHWKENTSGLRYKALGVHDA